MTQRDPLNFFSPYERLPAGHENQLTRALLLLLRMSPIAEIAAPENRLEFDRHFTDTARSTASPRPGLLLARRWTLTAEQLDARGALADQVRNALDTALRTLGERPLQRPAS